MIKPLGHCHHSLICKHILHHAFMWASAYSFHHSWIYYYSTLTAQSGNSEVDAIITILQKSLVLLNKQSTWIIQPVAKYLLSCNIILSHNLNNCILPLLNEGLSNPRFYKWIWYLELWNDKSNDVQINCIYDICVSTFWNTGVKTIFFFCWSVFQSCTCNHSDALLSKVKRCKLQHIIIFFVSWVHILHKTVLTYFVCGMKENGCMILSPYLCFPI